MKVPLMLSGCSDEYEHEFNHIQVWWPKCEGRVGFTFVSDELMEEAEEPGTSIRWYSLCESFTVLRPLVNQAVNHLPEKNVRKYLLWKYLISRYKMYLNVIFFENIK